MSAGLKFIGLLVASALCLPVAGRADTQTTQHPVHKVKKQAALPPPLPSGPQGPVPQIPLDAIPAVAPQVSYQDGMLTIVAPNSTLGDILRGVRKHTSADIDIPPTASERVVTRLGPGPAREVIAELLNGSHFNYILLGSPENANLLVRVVLVAKTADTPAQTESTANTTPALAVANNAAGDADAADTDDDSTDDTSEATEPEQPAADQPGVKTPQQMLQEMQQRQQQMQPGQSPTYPRGPGAALPPGQTPAQPEQQQ